MSTDSSDSDGDLYVSPKNMYEYSEQRASGRGVRMHRNGKEMGMLGTEHWVAQKLGVS